MVKRGEVWWVEHPRHGRRPYCVLTREEAIPVLSWVLAAPATTHTRPIPTQVPLDREDGMPRACALALDNLRPIAQSLLTERITALTPARMHQVCRALRLATNC